MSRLFKVQSFSVLLVVPSIAAAQIAPGQSGISTKYSFSGRQAFDDLNAFGTCFATKQTKDALKLVGTEAASADEVRVYKQLFSKEQFCLGDLSSLSVNWKFVRGAIGEGLYNGKVPVPAVLAAPTSMPPEKVQSVMDAAICYAQQHTSDARHLIEANKPGTKEEAAAIEALSNDFSACLPPNMPAGFNIDTLLLRYRIAEALWRIGQVHS
jgi:hypothetical protein